jgi:hypothetical protein
VVQTNNEYFLVWSMKIVNCVLNSDEESLISGLLCAGLYFEL